MIVQLLLLYLLYIYNYEHGILNNKSMNRTNLSLDPSTGTLWGQAGEDVCRVFGLHLLQSHLAALPQLGHLEMLLSMKTTFPD